MLATGIQLIWSERRCSWFAIKIPHHDSED
jgi:hypothetical protein